MPKPIELAVVVVATLGVGGTFFAGYLLGRNSTTPAAPRSTASPEVEDDDESQDPPATKTPPLRTAKRGAPPDAPASAEPSAPAAPKSAPREATVRASPDPDSQALQRLDPDAQVSFLEVRPGWRRIEGKAVDGSVVLGWIAWAENRPSSWGGVFAGAGRGVIQGTTRFAGKAPEMKVPKRRKDAEVCKSQQIPSNAVIVDHGRIADVLVRIARGEIQHANPAPRTPVKLDQIGCVYTPRIQGAMVGQDLEIWNGDPTLHNAHGYRGAETAWNKPQIKGAGPLRQELDNVDIFKITCDVHPWMRAFVVFTDHPYFAVSSLEGAWKLHGVPPGSYTLEAWHTQYGLTKRRVTVKPDEQVDVDFTFRDTDAEPPENRDELKDLW